MQIFIDNQYVYLLFSLAIGLPLGIIYDFFRLIAISLSDRKTINFVCDTFFILIWGIFIFFITFDKNYGTYRWYSFFASFVVFYAYRLTVGKIIIHIERKIISFLHKIIKYILKKIFLTLDFFLKFVKIIIRKFFSYLYMQRLLLEESKRLR